jgi:glucose/arabinose dehydrogenase
VYNNNQSLPHQRIAKRFTIFITITIFTLLLTACAFLSSNDNPPVTLLPETLTLPPKPTETPRSNPTDTPFPQCTPPPCKDDESYYCAEECPGGCGTTCATHTPTSSEIQPTITPLQPLNVQEFPNPADYQWQLVTNGLSSPIGLVHAGDDSGRLFILEQKGLIHIVDNGQLLPTPFLDLRSKIGSGGNEQGLLGLAFHPNYVQNGQFFVNYTDLDGDTIVSRLQVSNDPDIADPNSENLILRVQQPYQNHNGGHLLFGPDDYLYIGLGDGGSGGDPQGNGQNQSTLLGSMLRLDIDNSSPYAIPPDNPYVNGGGLSEIWATGLRNPWRYSFDRLTGDLYIGDVGQNNWEEIHFRDAEAPHGANFGWNYWEGLHPYQGEPPDDVEFDFPIWEYSHNQGCSITGGFSYRGSLTPWQGIYIYGDFCSGNVWGLLRDGNRTWQNTLLFETDFNITSFGEDQSGEIYLVDRTGDIYQLTTR